MDLGEWIDFMQSHPEWWVAAEMKAAEKERRRNMPGVFQGFHLSQGALLHKWRLEEIERQTVEFQMAA